MIKEDYVSFEIAKLLNEKGFDGECDYYYPEDGGEMQQLLLDELYYHNEDFIKCPTLQMAMKWLREVHNIFIDIRRSLNTYFYGAIIRKDPSDKFYKITEQFESYEKAVEAALKYSLENLI